MWVLRHAAALVGVKEDVVDVERRGNERLGVRIGVFGIVYVDCPKTLINRTEIEINLDFVVLEGNEG
jgi:hypothetical protein